MPRSTACHQPARVPVAVARFICFVLVTALLGCTAGGRRGGPAESAAPRRADQAVPAASGEQGPVAVGRVPWERVPAARVALADTADTLFWRMLHGGRYDSIPQAMFLLKAAYLENPRDPRTTAHIGFLHAWAAVERARLTLVPPTITDHLVLARTYFARAAALDPSDARVRGFHAAFEMADANVQRDTAALAAGLARGRAAIAAWPEFNWFTVGYTLSDDDPESPLFREAVEMQWQTMDACSRTRVDRANPSAEVARRAAAAERDPRRLRACWNSWIAPHNVEGFLLNMGDMLVKSGDWRTGVRVYALARGLDSYPRWAFRDVLEARIARAEQNVAEFRRPNPPGASSGTPIMLRSRFACVACHQR